MEALVVSIGPGSFTSLRIGLATAKGLCFRSPRRVAAVSTLEALAWAARAAEGTLVPLLDARRGEVYAAAYQDLDGEKPRVLVPEGVYTAEELAGRLPPDCLLLGEGVAVAGEALRERLGPEVRIAPPDLGPSARHVGALGARALAAGLDADVDGLVPRYLRRPQAEVQRTGLRFEGS